jgi:hypothetical protein
MKFEFLGSTVGGLSLVINGKGFSTSSTVTICGKQCTLIQADYSSIKCSV